MSIFPYIRHDMRAAFFVVNKWLPSSTSLYIIQRSNNKLKCELCESAADSMVKSASQLLCVTIENVRTLVGIRSIVSKLHESIAQNYSGTPLQLYANRENKTNGKPASATASCVCPYFK